MESVAQGVAGLSIDSPDTGPASSKETENSLLDLDSDNDFKDDPAPYYGQIPLTEEHKTAIFEILQCAVCLDVPMPGKNFQVKTCENGHHFCQSCRDKLTTCAICRGKLLTGRNFVVEEFINKLGKPFGIQKYMPKQTLPCLPAPRGKFQCPHCLEDTKIAASNMLVHIREMHKDELIAGLRTNPYTGWFVYKFAIPYESGQWLVKSYQVSDLGLLSLNLIFPAKNCEQKETTAWIQLLGKLAGHDIKYNLSISHGNNISGQVDLPILPFNTTTDDAPVVRLGQIEDGQNLEVSFLVSRSTEIVAPMSNWPLFCLETAIYPSDRASRRCLARNRRKRQKRAAKIAEALGCPYHSQAARLAQDQQ